MSLTSDTLGSVVARHRGRLALSALLAVVAGACSLAPYVAVYAVTVALFDGPPSGSATIGWIAAATAAALVVRAVASGLSTQVAHVAAYRILAGLRLAIARQMRRLPLGRVQARSTGETKKLLHDDVEQLEEALAHGVPDLAAAAAVPVTTTALLMFVDWQLGLVALGSLVLLVAVSGIGMALAASGDKELAARTAVLNKAVTGYLQGIKVIRGFLRPDSGYDQARDAVVTGAERYRATSGPMRWLVSATTVGTGFAVAALLPVAGLRFADGGIGLATLALFLLLALGYLTPLIGFVGVIATVMIRVRFAATAIREFLAEEPLPEPAEPQVPERFDIQLRGVSFAYAAGAPPVLRDVELYIPEGARFALVGPTGAGKSTIARLVTRFWDATAGTVMIGGVDVRDIPSAELARLVAFVQQDEYVFAATLRENVRIARPGASDAEVEAACRAAQLGALADQLPQGWDTPLPAGGGTLSGGQRQRVSVARALLKDAPIVVFDEATASLGVQTEQATLEAVAALTAGRTVVAIAHRLATIRGSDQIAYVADGEIVGQGTHEELLAGSTGYRALWDAYARAVGWRLERPDDAPAPALPTGLADGPVTAATIDPWEAAARSVVVPGLGAMGFVRQWRALLGRGWPTLLRRGLPALLLDGMVRGIPLLAVFLVLDAAVDEVAGGEALTSTFVWTVTWVLGVGLLLRLLTAQWANGVVWQVSAVAKADVQLSIVERLRRVPLGFLSRFDNGRVTTLIGNDIVMLDIQNIPQRVSGALLQAVYAAMILAVVDWRLALAALIGFPLFFVIAIWSDRVYRRVFADVHAARREAATVLIEQARGAAVLRGNPASSIATRYAAAVDRLRDASVATSVRATPAVALGAIAVESGLVVLILAGSAFYTSGVVAATTLLLFLMLTLTLYQPVQELNNLAGYRRNQQQIAQQIAQVWDAPVLAEPARLATPADASIEFRGVGFTYDERDPAEPADEGVRQVLRDVSFKARPGTVTALVGPSGAGKSTIANLAARLWDVDTGAVFIGGQDLRDLGSDVVMRMVTTVYQDVYLFHDTIRYNVTLGRPEATDDEIWAALTAAQCDDVVRALPDGLETVLDDGGTSLSGGQRQRLSIARALLKDSPILILDEAVASVDPDTEARIQDAIGRLAAGRTVLVIAHRLETVQRVDQLLWPEQSKSHAPLSLTANSK
ncbi:ABC transporter ATP-binding protein [Phytohabitans sp. ZYX-F-186]|uniref:ABC transporter ATP-binding protein n=1 Tax=Phytohabitans maris TaxID=3071409 RepID=A0ABU0ZR66_9ACTN|nr:ABC transporter ATP-binding protein [Phytohabitans sp. ZYX-F-186]MDQ7909525.1 ABC transporter ATP-binding protein [Phytohabitans sp. ZYX-F-186]